MAAFADAFTVLAWDAPGYGPSEDPEAPFSLEDLADDAARLLDEQGFERAHVLGVSLGGVIAQLVYQRHAAAGAVADPGRYDSGRWGGGRNRSGRQRVQARLDAIDRLGPREMARRRAPQLVRADAPAALVQELEDIMAEVRPAGYRSAAIALGATDLTARLGEIAAPTLVVHGADDGVVPLETGRALAAAIPGARAGGHRTRRSREQPGAARGVQRDRARVPDNRLLGLAMVRRTGGEIVLDCLKAAGVETVFGIISVHNIPIFDALAREGGIRLVPTRSEHGAASMADGFSRATGRLGAVITSTGVGAANAAGPLLEAFVASSPVLHITGQVDSAFVDGDRAPLHGAKDQLTMLDRVGKAAFRAARTEDIAAVMARGRRAGAGGSAGARCRWRFRSISSTARSRWSSTPIEAPRPVAPDAGALDRAAALLAKARRPLIWAGGGVISREASDGASRPWPSGSARGC